MRLAATRSSIAAPRSGGDCAHTLVPSAGSMIRARPLNARPRRRIAVRIVVSISDRELADLARYGGPPSILDRLVSSYFRPSGGLKPPRPQWQGRGHLFDDGHASGPP